VASEHTGSRHATDNPSPVSRTPVATLGLAAHECLSLARELARMPAERRVARPHPPKKGLVVDLGAGQSAFPRADAVVDKYVADDFERGHPLERVKPLIVADGQSLPFGDKALAYLIASHVLEHATDPERFAAEISRVARAGFVQLPSALAERAFGWSFHPWLVDRDGDTLVFSPKPVSDHSVVGPMHDLYTDSSLMRLLFVARRSSFHHSLQWEGGLRVRVKAPSTAEKTAVLDLERTMTALRRDPPPAVPAALRAALCCPICHGGLGDRRAILECLDCGREFPVVGTVPLLLEEAVGVRQAN
jgi:uncharacterized protein YbaR (Trm112 family)